MDLADWRVWCWSDPKWFEYPLEKMSVNYIGGVLAAKNTTGIYKRACLVYRSAVLRGDFAVSLEYRDDIESFDLQAITGESLFVSFHPNTIAPNWRKVTLTRTKGVLVPKIENSSVTLHSPRVDGSFAGYFCLKLQPNQSVEIRNFKLLQSR